MTDTETDWSPNPTGDGPVTQVVLRKSLILSFLDRYSRIAIRLASMAILARLLTPREYGIFTIGWIIITITQALRDFGVVNFLIQEKNISQQLVRTAFGVSLAIGCVLAVAVVISSGWIAAFYGDAMVRGVLLVLCSNFVLMPFSSIILALMRRDMRFGVIYVINVAGAAANATAAVAFALMGFGAMSLAWGSLASVATASVLAVMLQHGAFRLRPSLKEWRRVMSYGVFSTGGSLVASLGAQVPQLIIGRVLSLGSVGIYGRADSLVSMFDELVATSIWPVAISAIAQWHRTQTDIKNGFLRAIGVMTAIAWPFYAFIGLMAFPIVHILFGPEWDKSVPIARILCLSGALLSLSNLNGAVFQGRGEVKKSLWLQFIVQPFTFAFVAPAAFVNLPLVALAIVAASAIKVFVSYRFINPMIGITPADIAQATVKTLAITACSVVGPLLVLGLFQIDSKHIWLPTALAAMGAAAGWIAGVTMTRHPVGAEIRAMMRQAGGAHGSSTNADSMADAREAGFSFARYLKGSVSNIHRPGPRPNIFIFATPRSGSTFLLELLHAQPGMKLYNEPLSANRSVCRRELGVKDWKELTVLGNREQAYKRYFDKLQANRLKEIIPPLYRPYGRLLTNRIAYKILHGGEDMIGWFAKTYGGAIVILMRHPIPTAQSHEQHPRLPYMLQQPDFRALFSQREIAFAQAIIDGGSIFEKGVLSWSLQTAAFLRKGIDPSWAVISYEDLTIFPEASFAYLSEKLQLDPIDNLEQLSARPSGSTYMSDADTQKFLNSDAPHADRSFLINKWTSRVSDEDEQRAFAICAALNVDVYERGNLFPTARYRIPDVDQILGAGSAPALSATEIGR
jgi:O-antigen/teichoic acid export membrane protein